MQDAAKILPVTSSSAGISSKIRSIAYWIFTLLVVYEMTAGSLWDLLRIEYVRVVLAHLGYPMYLLTIMGVWKLPCAMALLAPGLPRLKEWAYAGAFFLYTGAAASHFSAGDVAGKWAMPLVLAGFTVASWALRSPQQQLSSAASPLHTRPRSWIVPTLILAGLLILAFVSLPKGPQPA
jgi:hypothetical protein